MLPAGVSAADFFLTAAAAAGTAAAISASAASTWRTGARQPVVFTDARTGLHQLKILYAPCKGAKKEAQRPVYSCTVGGYNHPGWATREAAEAAKAGFKDWVDSGMNAAQRAGAAATSSSRAEMSATVSLPSRHSSRVDVVCYCCRLAVCALATGAVANSTIEWVPMDAFESEAAWRKRSEHMLHHTAQARRWRQQHAVTEARVCVPDGKWEAFLERCRRVAAADEAAGVLAFRPKRHRGKSRVQLISQRSKARPDRHVQRREHRLAKQAHSVEYSTVQYSTVQYGTLSTVLQQLAAYAGARPHRMPYPVSSHLMPSRPIPSHPVPSRPIPSHLFRPIPSASTGM